LRCELYFSLSEHIRSLPSSHRVFDSFLSNTARCCSLFAVRIEDPIPETLIEQLEDLLLVAEHGKDKLRFALEIAHAGRNPKEFTRVEFHIGRS